MNLTPFHATYDLSSLETLLIREWIILFEIRDGHG
jgi:hypothetical protein